MKMFFILLVLAAMGTWAYRVIFQKYNWNQKKLNDLEKMKNINDFYYNYNYQKIFSKSNPDFFIHYFSGYHQIERGNTYKFVLNLNDFSVIFLGGKSDYDTDWKLMGELTQKNGVLTFPIKLVGTVTAGVCNLHINNEFISCKYNYVSSKFVSKKHQDEMLELFERAMLAFPASTKIESEGSIRFFSETQNGSIDDYLIGAKIVFIDELLKQIENGDLIE